MVERPTHLIASRHERRVGLYCAKIRHNGGDLQTAPEAPRMNAHCERLIQTSCRELTDSWPLSSTTTTATDPTRPDTGAGNRHAAQRNLFNRFLGLPTSMPRHGQAYDEEIAFPLPHTHNHETATTPTKSHSIFKCFAGPSFLIGGCVGFRQVV